MTEKRALAAARIIAANDSECGGDNVPCVPDPPGSPDECQCVRTAREALAAAEAADPVVFDIAADDGHAFHCEVAGPSHVVVVRSGRGAVHGAAVKAAAGAMSSSTGKPI
jgi:hypothetical protein